MKHWPARFGVVACSWLVICLLTLSVSAQSPEKQPNAGKEPKQQSEETALGNSAEEGSGSEQESSSTVAVESTEPILAIMGAQVHTMSDAGIIPEGVVLVQGNEILKVGDLSTEIPEGAERIDVTGLIMTPGLIDCRSRLWLTAAAANSSASDASLNVFDGVDGFSEDWHEVVRQGITSVYVQPARQGTAGGYGAVLSVAPSENGPQVIAEHAALQASLGVGASNNRSRSQQFERTKKLFAAAEEYQKKWDEYNAYLKKKAEAKKKEDAPDASKKGNAADPAKSQAAGNRPVAGRRPVRGRGGPGGGPGGDRPGRGRPGSGVRPVKSPAEGNGEDAADADAKKGDEAASKKEEGDKKEEPPKKPAKDPAKELLAKVVLGVIPLRLEIHTADDVHYAMQLLDEFKDLQVVLEGLSNLGSATQSVVELGVPVVLGPWLESEPLRNNELTSCSDWSKAFADYDGTLSLATFGSQARSSRWLRAHLGRAVANGFEVGRALRSVTVDAAKLLGISDQLGTLEAGKRADLVCFSGDPVDASATASLVISAGRVVHQEAGNVTAEDATTENAEQRVAELSSIALPDRYGIKSERVLTSSGELEPQLIVVNEGKIESLEAFDTEPEDGLTVIDAGQAVVTPGLFSAHATFGIERLIDPDSQSDSTYVVAGDVFVGSVRGERERVESGLLRALLSPGDANPIAGTASLVRLGADGASADRLAASKFVLTSKARDTDRYPSSLAGQVQLVRQSLAGTLLESRVYLPKPVVARLAARRTEAFDSIQRGERLVLIAAETDAEIRAALDLIETQRLRAALLGPRQLEPFIDRIKALDVAVIARPALVADYHWYAADLVKAQQAGIPVYFAGETAEQLRLTAALAVSAGMHRATALSALFNGPQELLNTNVLSGGVPADLVVWSDSPIHLGAKPLLVLVNGKAVDKLDE